MKRRLMMVAAAILMASSGCCLDRHCIFVDYEDVYNRTHCGNFLYDWCHCPFSCPECPYFDYDACLWAKVPAQPSVIAVDSFQHPNLSIPIQQ